LTCSGDGGSVSSSVSVTATTAIASHSGGGALGLEFLSGLLVLLIARLRPTNWELRL
jgi:hypothetical protein